MDGQERQPSDPDDVRERFEPPSLGLSRRAFTRRVGGGSAVAMGFALAAPKISTIRYATKVVVGSGPPEPTTTTTTVPTGPLGEITVSTNTPCVGDTIRVQATGFAPNTAVTLELNSPAHTLGVTTADSHGNIDVQVQLRKGGLTGVRILKAVGVRTGGKTLTLSTPITIKTEIECGVPPTSSTTTTKGNPPVTAVGGTSTSSTSTTTTSTSVPTKSSGGGGGGGGKPLEGNSLAFTGTDAIDLALIGGAAAIGGRALYGLVRRGDEDEDDE